MLKNTFYISALVISMIFVVLISEINGHGMMLDPVSRSSRWRYDKTAPINYDDNGLFCGGFGVQWFQNHGKCGLCGDNFATPTPRPNELGGLYGEGVITKAYSQSQIARLGIDITANHLGFFYFDICNLDKFQKESEICFSENKIKFSDGSLQMYIGKKRGMIYPNIVLPKDLNCKHCVLRWNYQAGNNWGPCGNGSYAVGCGPQENFKGCSDITIGKQSSRTTKADRKNKLLKVILNRKIYSDYDGFAPRRKSQYKDNDFDDIIFEFENENEKRTVPMFYREQKNGIDDDIDESDEEEEDIVPISIEDRFYKKRNGAFDKEVFNKVFYNLFDSAEMHDTVEEPAKVDQSDLDFFEFDKEELAKNYLDDSFDDIEYD